MPLIHFLQLTYACVMLPCALLYARDRWALHRVNAWRKRNGLPKTAFYYSER